jgi:hypothetical protein
MLSEAQEKFHEAMKNKEEIVAEQLALLNEFEKINIKDINFDHIRNTISEGIKVFVIDLYFYIYFFISFIL